ncbi:YpmA family protein [Halobacillus karajensis]|nr:YpmA family protein [Halobacillus karajensis]
MEVVWMENKIETLSTVRIQKSDDLYKIVDTLNRTLKEKNLMFGLALDDDDADTAVFTIYRT